MAVTIQVAKTVGIGECEIKEWKKAGLLKPSSVKPAISTIEQKLITRKLGKLSTQMRITYDSKVDALYISFLETNVTTKHVAEGIAVDYDAEGRIAGIEILNAAKHFGSEDVFRKVTIEDLVIQSG